MIYRSIIVIVILEEGERLYQYIRHIIAFQCVHLNEPRKHIPYTLSDVKVIYEDVIQLVTHVQELHVLNVNDFFDQAIANHLVWYHQLCY